MISLFVSLLIILKDSRKKIVFSFYNLGLGGIQTKIIDLANELSKDTSYTTIVYLQEKTNFDRSYLLHKNVHVLYCPTIFPKFIKNRYHYLLCFLIIGLRPLTLFTSLEETSLFAIKHIKKFNLSTKIIVNIDTFFKAEQKRKSTDIKKIFNQADIVLAVSQASYTDLKDRVGVSVPPLSYIPNWTLGGSTKGKKFYTHKKDILFLGRFEDQKNPLLILKFAQLLKRNRVATHIHMYGSGSLESKLKQKIDSMQLEKYITIHPISHQPKELIKKSKYIIVTSKYEGLSFSMLEAMSLGTVMLTLNAPGVSELIVNGSNGCIQDSAENLFEQFLKVEEDTHLYRKLQKNAFILQQKEFGKNTMMKLVKRIKEPK